MSLPRRTPRLRTTDLTSLFLVLAALALAPDAGAQELRAAYNGRVIHLELEGSYPRYTIQRAASPEGPFETLEYNPTGCIGLCTYDDYGAQLDQFYLYRVIVALTGGGERVYGPTPFTLDPKAGLALHVKSTPNPTPGPATISWMVPAAIARQGEVRSVVTVHDPTGRETARVFDRSLPVGVHEVEWDGLGSNGQRLPTGSYFYRVQVGAHSEVGRLVLLGR